MNDITTDKIGVYYILPTKTLMLGIPLEDLSPAIKRNLLVVFPFKAIIQAAKLRLKDIERIAITSIENFNEITEHEENRLQKKQTNQDELWEEFLKWRTKWKTKTTKANEVKAKEKEKEKSNVLNFSKDHKEEE